MAKVLDGDRGRPQLSKLSQSIPLWELLSPYQKSTLKKLISRPLLKIAMHHKNILKKRTMALDPPSLPAYAVYAHENDDNSGQPLRNVS